MTGLKWAMIAAHYFGFVPVTCLKNNAHGQGAKQAEDVVVHSSRKRVRISAKHGDSALDEVSQCKMIIIIQ